jgi:hypothetical protein
MAPKPTVVNPVTPNNTFGPKPAPAVVGVKKSNTGLIVTLIVILVIILAGIAIWILKPFAFMQAPATNSNIEEKVEKPVTKPSDSLFPSSVVNKPAATSSKPAPTKTSNTYSATDQQKITDYLGANINKLAKTTGYTVDDVSFDGPGRAIVSYSKNGVSRSAVVNAYVDSSGAVRVTSFMVLTK